MKYFLTLILSSLTALSQQHVSKVVTITPLSLSSNAIYNMIITYGGGGSSLTNITDSATGINVTGPGIDGIPAQINSGNTYADSSDAAKAKWLMYGGGGVSASIYGIGISAGQYNFFTDIAGDYVFHWANVEKIRFKPNGDIITSGKVGFTNWGFNSGNLLLSGPDGAVWASISPSANTLYLAAPGSSGVSMLLDSDNNTATVIGNWNFTGLMYYRNLESIWPGPTNTVTTWKPYADYTYVVVSDVSFDGIVSPPVTGSRVGASFILTNGITSNCVVRWPSHWKAYGTALSAGSVTITNGGKTLKLDVETNDTSYTNVIGSFAQ